MSVPIPIRRSLAPAAWRCSLPSFPSACRSGRRKMSGGLVSDRHGHGPRAILSASAIATAVFSVTASLCQATRSVGARAARSSPDLRHGASEGRPASVLLPHFRGSPEPRLAAGRRLPWHEAQPGWGGSAKRPGDGLPAERVPPAGEGFGWRGDGVERNRRHGPDARHGLQSTRLHAQPRFGVAAWRGEILARVPSKKCLSHKARAGEPTCVRRARAAASSSMTRSARPGRERR